MWTRLALLFLALSACEHARDTEPAREVADRLGAVRCKLESAKVTCAGDNTWGLVRAPAAPERVESWSPIPIPEKIVALDLSPMSRFACAVGTSGAVYCWGDAAGGKLGNGEVPDWPAEDGATARPVPARVLRARLATDVRLGVAHACVLTREGGVQCWGDGAGGELGRGDQRSASGEAIDVIEGDATAIAVVDAQTCAVLQSGHVSCWGAAIPVPGGSLQRVNSPTELDGIDDATGLTSEGSQMCVSRRSGPRTCWTPMDWPRGTP